MAKKGPIIAIGAITGVLFFWRKKRKNKGGADDSSEVANDEVTADA
jgi:hypothetical protein